nr:hypothetical protein [Micromonospora sp. DSM 115978]
VNRVVVQRLSGRRAERAKLFFEPKPAMPRCDLVPATTQEPADWRYALGGGAVVALGAALLLIGPIGPGAALGVLTLAMAARLLVRHVAQHRTLKLCAQAKHNESETPDWHAGPRSPRHWVRTDFTSFVQEVHRLVELRFSEARPHLGGNWPSYTEVTRARLKFRLVDRYGNEGSPTADRLDWLIRWHAR